MSLTAASQVVEQALAGGRVGTPVALRLVVHTTADHGRVERLLADSLDAACRWLAAQPAQVQAQGGVEAGHTSVLVRFASGQTAVISAGTAPERDAAGGGKLFELVLIGNRGVLSWESDGAAGEDEQQGAKAPPGGAALLAAVRESLASGQAVTLSREAAENTKRASAAEGPNPPQPALPKGGSDAVLASPGGRASALLRRGVSASPRPRVAAQRPPYGLLIVTGAHTHQENYATALAADERVRLIGLTDEPGVSERRARLNARLADELGIALLPDLDEALARDDVHLVSICAEPERRGPIIVRCARAGKHLYLDKPLTATVEEADAVVEAVEQAGVVSQMFSLVQTPWARRIRSVVESGEIGELVGVHCDLCFAKGQTGTAALGEPREETARPEHFEAIESKRELTNVGVYPVVMISWLLGRPVRSVYAATGNYFFREHQANGMEDFGAALMRLEGGVTASIMVGRTGWRSHPMSGVNRTYLVGTRGVACIDAFRPRIEVYADEPPWMPPERPHPEDPMGFWSSTQAESGVRPKRAWLVPDDGAPDDATAFLDCVEQGRPSEVPAAAGAMAVEVIAAAYQSAAAGEVVGLPLARS